MVWVIVGCCGEIIMKEYFLLGDFIESGCVDEVIVVSGGMWIWLIVIDCD